MTLSRQFLFIITLAYTCCTSMHVYASGFLGLSIGYYNAFDNDKNSAVFKAEYISGSSVFLKNLNPWGGASVTSNGSIWLGGGLLYNIALNNKLYLTPSLGAGIYYQGSNDINLGYPLIFRTQIELSYSINTHNHIGLALSHSSNASLGHDNSGAETIEITYKRAIGADVKPN